MKMQFLKNGGSGGFGGSVEDLIFPNPPLLIMMESLPQNAFW